MLASPPLTELHKEKRVAFATKHLLQVTDFGKWVFNGWMDVSDGVYCYCHIPGELQKLRSKRSFGGGSLMFWGGAIQGNKKLASC